MRRALARIALCLIPLSWLAIALVGLRPNMGHVAWVAGLTLMLGPEAIGERDI